jgi:hypothetical protein
LFVARSAERRDRPAVNNRPIASAPTLDYAAAAMRAKRSCCVCGRTCTAESVQSDPGWEPIKSGWRCGDCSRSRAREVRAGAHELIAQAEPRWELALRTPEHRPFDECLECEAVLAAREMLLAWGALARVERDELAAALLTNV